MKILKIFGLVVGIHLFALFLIFAVPGCSSTSRQIPVPSDTLSRAEPSPTVTLPPATAVPGGTGMDYSHGSDAPMMFNPDAPAVASRPPGGGVRFTPTRPGSPAASSLVAEPVADVTPASTYTVVSGDSLWSIAKRKGLTVAELAEANGLRANAVLHPGQKLIISGRPAHAVKADSSKAVVEKPAALPAKPPASGEYVHVVKRGETLSTIARRYDVSQREIAVRNNITDPQMIPEGKELVIPGWKATDAKSGKEAASQAGPDSGSAESTASPAPPQPFQIPVIRVDDSPLTPAPKG